MTMDDSQSSSDSRADRFLAAFSGVERKLREMVAGDRGMTFYQLVDRASEGSRAVYQYKNDLKEYADLRNAIVHERGDGRPIADPREEAVEHIEHLRLLVTNPPSLFTIFQGRVLTCGPEETIAIPVRHMYEGNFSQLPVYDGDRFDALLTAETVARWVASSMEGPDLLVTGATVRDVLAYTEDIDNHRLVDRKATVFDAMTLFQRYSDHGKSLDAILITESGHSKQRPLGIVTIHDMPRLLAAVRT